MTLKTDRLIIDPISWANISDMHALYSLKEICLYNTIGNPSSIKETKKLIKPYINDRKIEERKNLCWAIKQNNNEIFIGCIGMNIFADRFRLAKIFFYLKPDFWGKGFATESAKEIIKFGFNELSLHRIEAGTDTANLKSLRVLEKCNMKNEGIRRKLLPLKDEWKDCFQYSILETDPRDF